MPQDFNDMDDNELRDIFNSKMVQKYLAYRDLASGIRALKEDDVMYKQLLQGIHSRYNRVNQDTINKVLKAFVQEVETNTDALESADDEERR